MSTLNRRQFSQETVGALLTFSLLETLFENDAFTAEIKPITAQWLKDLNDLGKEVRGKKIKQLDWQKKCETLFAKANLKDLLKYINFKKLTANLKLRDTGERSLRAQFPKVEGLPTSLVFGHQVFAVKKGASVVPHGHNNMATAFLIMDGTFHGRHYDRLKDEKKHLIIKPTIDKSFKAGGYSTVSDHKDNIHWFKSTSDKAFIFNIHVNGIVKGKRSGRVYVDPNGEKIAGGKIRAKRIGSREAYKIYG